MKNDFRVVRENDCQRSRMAWTIALGLITLFLGGLPSFATIGSIVKSDLTGSWQIALRGNTGCGFSALQANVTMNTSGVGTGTLNEHGPCGNLTFNNINFTIKALAANGKGTANLTCGSGCGWNLTIQVSPDRSKINLTDVSSANPGNFIEGVAILSSSAGDIAISDLTGEWQLTILGFGGCGTATSYATFTLNSSGVANNVTTTSQTAGCGDSTTTGNTFTVTSLNANGSGTANLSCGTGCGFNLNIQVSPDRSTFNLVDMTNGGNYLAGTAIRKSNAGDVSLANLSGPWQLALYGQTGCGDTDTLVNFTLPVSGATTTATSVSHSSGCGNGTASGISFTVQSLNADGSGTANLSCGSGCGFNLNIQVSPDRSSFNVVDVSNGGNYQVGTAIHQ